jgi:hypothetical protein
MVEHPRPALDHGKNREVAEHQVDHEQPPQDALVPPHAGTTVGEEAFFHSETPVKPAD